MTKSRTFRPDQDLDTFLDKNPDVPVRDAIENYYRQKFSRPQESITTSDGRYAIIEGKLYRVDMTFGRPVYTQYHPEELEQKVVKLNSEEWKRRIAEEELAMKREAHSADMTLKKVQILRAQKRYAPETIPQRCKVPGCPVAGVVFKDLAALNEHLREYHPDRVIDDHGRTVSLERITAGDFWRQQAALPQPKWSGEFG